MSNSLNTAYYAWLCDLVGVSRQDGSYWLLASDLHQKDFRWFVPNDDNRAFEGKNLREKFCDETGIAYDYDSFDDEVSMLELIIALAYRCESIMEDQIEHMEMEDWFWKMMSNSGLDAFTDDSYYALRGQVVVDQILERIINRTYQRDGSGGLFPLNRPREDQRSVEIWYQMNTYLVENYFDNEAV